MLNPNWNYSDKTLYASIESSVTDRLTDYGYETGKTGFSLGSAWEQYDDVIFSPKIKSFYEKLDTNQSATANLKKQEGNILILHFLTDLIWIKEIKDFRHHLVIEVGLINQFQLISETNTLRIVI